MTKEENKIEDIEVYGKLYIGLNGGTPFSFYLLNPQPVVKLDTWLRDNDICFYACNIPRTDNEVVIARNLILRGEFLIDFSYAGRKVKIRKQEVRVDETDIEGHPA